ncbi:hypothetical protein C6Y14_20515 [Streptomyces dioscori]|uniref:Bacterial transcriptional activator domain-containing protein n=1 Tax=Streptomyces dioscori TaxID=2109333 RepID=A0A2P8Q629_9ACTN|nr:hypothetical protein C6Y14_20515 [Streptomyces dioscori]
MPGASTSEALAPSLGTPTSVVSGTLPGAALGASVAGPCRLRFGLLGPTVVYDAGAWPGRSAALDVGLFEDRVVAARAAHARRDWGAASAEAVAALALWRGTPSDGWAPEAGGISLVQRLDKARLFALECRYDADLELSGGAAEQGVRLSGLAPELAALVAEFPLREAFHRQLMLVLYRTGRQAEALAVRRDLRGRLVRELGVEPGNAVREAHLEILREPKGVASGGGPAAITAHPRTRTAEGAAAGRVVAPRRRTSSGNWPSTTSTTSTTSTAPTARWSRSCGACF